MIAEHDPMLAAIEACRAGPITAPLMRAALAWLDESCGA